MWSNLRKLSSSVLQVPKCYANWSRTVFILERVHPPRLNKLGSVFQKKLKSKNYKYRLVENTDIKKKPDLDLILLRDVPGIGLKGENIKINYYIGYRDLLLPKLAVYADSEEALILDKKVDKTSTSSKYSKVIEKFIVGRPLSILMHPENPWVLEPWHIKFALRQIGITAKDDCIKLPENKISGPDIEIENKDFIVHLIMNKTEKFPIRCRIYQAKSIKKTDFDNKLKTTSEALFPEDQNQINDMMKVENEVKARYKEIVFDKEAQGKKKKKKSRPLYAPVGAFNKYY